ncbi:hypothetical protein G6L63_11315 [Agrobacterium vitis]|nr:hypothetical protein [Agrobacterium vitis]KAA3512589.1 hypothetical protein DXM22_15100 [Agrobacterium vitis]MUZ99091.1 hypothetical protein [Agrobacterium vitis]MVA31638.1 hypothetical protein [Agrobacterium vitis]NSZ48499.1 hypothetical protein [Agrobacterium vitis]RCU48996.1 hypothetical protein ASB66_024550 [Agrobacterium vitis]
MFVAAYSKAIDDNIKDLSGNAVLTESYARIAAVNAVKVDLIDQNMTLDAAHFFYEAHNDAVLSHVNASFGCWRPALQALRSFMENTLSAIYYADHPIELEKWKNGKFSIPPKELRAYVIEHPKVQDLALHLDLKSLLDGEYSTLSKAVHASNSLFRMTSADGKTSITKPNQADLGKWSARERETISLCMTIVASVMCHHLEGAKLPQLRDALGIAVGAPFRAALKAHCKISIPAP